MRYGTVAAVVTAAGLTALLAWSAGRSPAPPVVPAPAAPSTTLAAAAGTAAPRAAGPTVRPAVQHDGSLLLHVRDAGEVQAPFALAHDEEAAEGVCLEVPPGAEDKPGLAQLSFVVEKPGVYSVFIRAYWSTDGEKACSNSVTCALDDLAPVAVEDATYESWHWVPAKFGVAREGAVELAAGTHHLRFFKREKAIRIDQVFLTPWFADEFERRVPQGNEWAKTAK